MQNSFWYCPILNFTPFCRGFILLIFSFFYLNLVLGAILKSGNNIYTLLGCDILKIAIGNLDITNYCVKNINHVKFRRDLIKDESIYEFVSTTVGNDLEESEKCVKLELGYSYIIEDYDFPVGYIYIGKIKDFSDIVELRYAVHSDFRRLGYFGHSNPNRKGYGQQILEECSSYLFTLDHIKSIELHIRKDNMASIGCAEKSNYKCVGSNEEEYYYIYRKLKK